MRKIKLEIRKLCLSLLLGLVLESLFSCSDDVASVPDAFVLDSAADANSDGPGIDAPPLAGETAVRARYVARFFYRASPGDPIPDAFARIENTAGEFLEATTDVDGNVTFMVDASKGPFDLSFAKAGYQPVSVLDVTESPGDIKTYPVVQPLTVDVTGTISGKSLPSNRVNIDTLGAVAIQRTQADYLLHLYGSSIPAPIVGIEVDATGAPVNIVGSVARTYDAPVTAVDLAFSAPAPAVTTTTFPIEFPTTGVITGAVTNEVSQAGRFSQLYVIKSYEGVPLSVGSGRVTPPSNSVATATVRHFEGEFAPTAALAQFNSGDGDPYFGTGGYFPVTGTAPTIPTVDALEMAGTTLEDLAGTAVGAGWGHTYFVVYGEDSSLWRIYPSAANVTNRRMPHLPSQFSPNGFDTITGAAVWLIKNGSTEPLWQDERLIESTYAFWYSDL
jgi:hypothetical protein